MDDPTVSQRPDPLEPRLLDVTITGWSKDDMPGIASTIAENVEAALPIHDTRDDIQTGLRESPVVHAIPKRALQRGALTLLILLMVTAFLAVALEYRNERPRLVRAGAGA